MFSRIWSLGWLINPEKGALATRGCDEETLLEVGAPNKNEAAETPAWGNQHSRSLRSSSGAKMDGGMDSRYAGDTACRIRWLVVQMAGDVRPHADNVSTWIVGQHCIDSHAYSKGVKTAQRQVTGIQRHAPRCQTQQSHHWCTEVYRTRDHRRNHRCPEFEVT